MHEANGIMVSIATSTYISTVMIIVTVCFTISNVSLFYHFNILENAGIIQIIDVPLCAICAVLNETTSRY